MKLGSWLIARGKISGVQLKRALLDQSFYGGHLSSSLMKLGYLDEPTLGAYLADVFQVPYAGADRFQDIAPDVVRIIPEYLAQKHQMVPLAVEGKKLRLAMMNPADILVMDEVAFLTGLQVEPCVSSEPHLLDALERYYQLSPSVRETIPLADQLDGRQNPLTARRQIMEASDAPGSQPGASQPAPEAGDDIGLDGRPLSASAESLGEFYPTPGHASAEKARGNQVPRSLDEWRESPASEAVAAAEPTAPPPAPRVAAAEAVPSVADPTGVMPSLSASPAHASTPKRPVLSLVPTPSSVTLEQISERLKHATTRDEVFEAVLDFCESRFPRCAVFLVTPSSVVGFGGRGEGFDSGRIRAVKLDLEAPSIFSYFRTGSEFYFGPVPGLPANQQFYRGLGLAAPDRVLLVPVQIKERLIALVYGDFPGSRREDPDVALFRRLVQKAVLALEILILRNKISMV